MAADCPSAIDPQAGGRRSRVRSLRRGDSFVSHRAIVPALAALLLLSPETAFAAAFDGGRWASPGRCPSSASCSRSRCFRFRRRMSGSITRARSPPSGRCSSWRRWRRSMVRKRPRSALLHTAAPRIHALHPPAARAVHGRGRHPGARQPPRLAGARTRRCSRSAPLLASLIGTTGASMVLIRPLLRANDDRAAQRPCGRVLHLPGVEYRRLADAARRSAAVPRLPARRRFLLDRTRSSGPRRCSSRRAARRVLRDRSVVLHARGPRAGPIRRRTSRVRVRGLRQFRC